MMHKKGQGAMEYLMTYGWAILVVIIVGVVLWQMGVFTPGAGTAASFSGFGNVKPNDWSCDPNGDFQVVFINGQGGSIVPTAVTADGTAASSCSPALDNTVAAGDKITCTWTTLPSGCSSASSGSRFESDIELTYNSTTGIEKVSSGTIWGPAE